MRSPRDSFRIGCVNLSWSDNISVNSPRRCLNTLSGMSYTAAFIRSESRAGKSQISCCFCPMTRVIFWRKALSRRKGICPATLIRPDEGWIKPVSIFRVVVLPAPFGPKKPTISPEAIAKDMSLTAAI